MKFNMKKVINLTNPYKKDKKATLQKLSKNLTHCKNAEYNFDITLIK